MFHLAFSSLFVYNGTSDDYFNRYLLEKVNVGLLIRHLEQSSKFLSVLYPVLVVAVNHVGAQGGQGNIAEMGQSYS